MWSYIWLRTSRPCINIVALGPSSQHFIAIPKLSGKWNNISKLSAFRLVLSLLYFYTSEHIHFVFWLMAFQSHGFQDAYGPITDPWCCLLVNFQ